MIPNIVVPIPTPMPVHSSGGVNADPKLFIALFCAVFIFGLVCYVIGYLKDGIRYGKWGLNDNNDSMWKMCGSATMTTILGLTALIGIVALIYSWL